MSKVSPMQQSLKHLRSQGFLCKPVEHWNPYAKVRQDLWGADILAAGWLKKDGCPTRGLLFVQTTTWANVPARVAKLKENPDVKRVIEAGGFYVVHGWDRNRFREVEVTL